MLCESIRPRVALLLATALGLTSACRAQTENDVECAEPDACPQSLCTAGDEEADCIAVGLTECTAETTETLRPARDAAGQDAPDFNLRSCDPVLPDGPCPAGTAALLGASACVTLGPTCGEGFVAETVESPAPPGVPGAPAASWRGCRPVLPGDDCPAGFIAKLGSTTCHRLGPCESPVIGDLHVDAAADSMEADGTSDRPFVTVADALSAAASDDVIVIAPGIYAGPLVIEQPVTLQGRCTETVRLETPESEVAIFVALSGGRTRLAGLTVAGGAGGIEAHGAGVLELEDMEIASTDGNGVSLFGEGDPATRLEARHLRVRDVESRGIHIVGARADLEDIHVADVSDPASGLRGRCVQVEDDLDGPGPSRLEILGAVIERCEDTGVIAFGADVILRRVVVRDIEARGLDETGGAGIHVEAYGERHGTLILEDGLVERSRLAGVVLVGAEGTLRHAIVTGTRPQASDDRFGTGLHVQDHVSGASATVTLEDSLLSANRYVGLMGMGAQMTVRRSVIIATEAEAGTGTLGWGLSMERGLHGTGASRLEIDESLIDANREVGVVMIGGELVASRSLVRGTRPNARDGTHGHGIVVARDEELEASVFLDGMRLAENRDVGLMVAGATGRIERSLIHHTHPQASDETGGWSIAIQPDPDTGFPSNVEISDSLVADGREVGIGVLGSEARIRNTAVQRILPNAAGGLYGVGITVQREMGQAARLELERSLVEATHTAGVQIVGSESEIHGSIIWGTGSDENTQWLGDGLAVVTYADETVTHRAAANVDGLVSGGNGRAGAGLFAAGLTLARAQLVCNAFDLNVESTYLTDVPGELGSGDAALEDVGANACGCAGSSQACQASSTGLQPAPPPNR